MPVLRKLLLVATLVVVTGCSQTSLEDHLVAARGYLAESELDAALIEVKNALSREPQHGEARLLAGRIHLLLGDGASAEKELQRALSLGESPGEIQPLLANALYMQNELDRVLEIDPEQAWMTPEEKAEVRAVRGMVYIAQEKPDKAEIEFKAGQEQDRDAAGILAGFGWLAAVRQDSELGREFADRAMAIDPSHPEIWSLLGNIEVHEGNYEAAAKAFDKAVELRPYHVVDNLHRVGVNLELGKFGVAARQVQALRAAKVKAVKLDQFSGLIAYQGKDFERALASFEKAIQADPNDMRSLYFAGTSALQLERFESAALYLSRFNGRNPGFVPAIKMLAWLELRNGNYPQAEMLVREVLAREPEDVFTLNLLADTLAQEDRNQESIEVFQEIVKLSPDSAAARSRLGYSLMSAGMVEEGLAELESAGELAPERQDTQGAIIFTLLREGRVDEALAKASELIEANPDSAYARAGLGTVYIQRKEYDKAKEAFEKTLELSPDNITARSGLASIAAQAGKLDDAKSEYREILKRDKGNLTAALNLAYISAHDGNVDEMTEVLEKAIELNPNAVLPRLSLARYHQSRSDHARVIELLEPVQAYSGDSYEYLQMLSESQYRSGKFQDARRNLGLMTQYAPKSADIRYMYAVTLRRTGDKRSALEEIDQVLKLNADHAGARLQRAELLLETGNFEGARAEADILKKQLGGASVEVATLEGNIASATGDHSAAVAAFGRAFTGRDTNVNLLNLERATWASGDKEGAISLLEDWLAKVPGDQLAQFHLGGRLASMEKVQEAADVYRAMLKTNPSSSAIMNNLAWVLQDTDTVAALEYGEQALSLNPDSHEIKSTLAMVLKKQDNNRAMQLMREALRGNSEDPRYQYYQAVILHEAKRDTEARTILKRVLKEVPDFAEADKARALLATLGG